jgi:hypothetical protein
MMENKARYIWGFVSVIIQDYYTELLYRVIKNDCLGFNNLSHTIHFR